MAIGEYCMYLRKSRADMDAEARGEGETLARHERTLFDLAARGGLFVAPEAVYREVVTGDTIGGRPQMQRLLADVEAGRWNGVLVMEVERLARGDTIDQGIVAQAFRYSNTRIITPYKTYNPNDDMDEEFFEFSLFMSRREYKTIKRRLLAGRLASAKEGKYMGSRPVYGYERVKLSGQKGYSLNIVPEKAAIVRMIFDWYANGMDGQTVGADLIAKRLDELGIRTDMGNKFTADTLRYLLQNSAYIGMVRWNQRVTEVSIKGGEKIRKRPLSDEPVLVRGLHDPIIDEGLFNRVQTMFASHAKNPVRSNQLMVNPLAGLVLCPNCGRYMQRKNDYNGRSDTLTCPTPRCKTRGAYLPAVEEAILQTLREWVRHYDVPPLTVSPLEESADEAQNKIIKAQLESQLKTLNRQMDSLHDLLEQGIYTAETFLRRSSDLNARISELTVSLKTLDHKKPRSMEEDISAVVPQARTVLDAYNSAHTIEQKNALLKSVIDKVIYHKERQCFRNNAPSDYLTLEVYPAIFSANTDNVR